MKKSRPPIVWSTHALSRYCERVRPLTEPQARLELGRLASSVAEIQADPPPWANVADQEADGWLWMADDTIAAPLRVQKDGVLLAVSLYVEGSLSDTARRHRNVRAANHRAGKRTARTLELDGQRRTAPEAGEW